MVDQRQPLIHDSLSRRAVIAGVTAVAGGVVLAACGGRSSSTPPASSAPPASSIPPSSAPPASPTSATTSPAAPASSSPASADADAIVALKTVPVGGAVSAQLDGKPIIVSQPTAGQAAAFSAICTHLGCTVKPDGAKLNCPCHGSVFDALTGKNIDGPAPKPLAAIKVTVSDGKVVAA